jgi:hypothetical protein
MQTENPNHSTGPKSPEGKSTSSKNALKHGSCSLGTLILANESLDDFLALEKTWFQGYGVNPDNPATAHEAELIRTAARADWFYQRSDRNYCEVEAKIINAEPDLLNWSDTQHQAVARFQRYRTTNANILAKHRKAIEDYRKSIAAEAAQHQKMRHAEEKVNMARQKCKIYVDKNTEPDFDAIFEGMRQKAIRLGRLKPDETPAAE